MHPLHLLLGAPSWPPKKNGTEMLLNNYLQNVALLLLKSRSVKSTKSRKPLQLVGGEVHIVTRASWNSVAKKVGCDVAASPYIGYSEPLAQPSSGSNSTSLLPAVARWRSLVTTSFTLLPNAPLLLLPKPFPVLLCAGERYACAARGMLTHTQRKEEDE
jgi:hypothetical protein